ncbi:MAG TPA: ATP-binding protein [Trueperaceae bacterium]|nr:ATP-binding protein [Trueperaceae bacterium]
MTAGDGRGSPEAPPEGAAGWFDALDEGVLQHDGRVVTRLNRSAAELLDVAPERAVGRTLIGVLRDHRLEELTREEDGRLEVELRGRPVVARSRRGALLLRDVSDVRASQRDARELLAVLSHELRTPAAAVVAVLDALRGDLPPELRGRFLARAREEAERLTRLLGDLTVDVRPPRVRTLQLDAVVERAAVLTQPVREGRGVRLRAEPSGMEVRADEDKLLQALVNLLENAAVHGPSGGEVEVVARRVGEAAHVEVKDRGEPLPASDYERLFEPRTQGGPKAKGTGLGLYIVRSVAAAWGGEAWGGPRRDGARGSAFGFSVPLAE